MCNICAKTAYLCRMKFDPAITVAFTGHRSYRGESVQQLDHAVSSLADRGATTFLCGMAVGFDMAAAESVMRMRTLLADREIRLVAVVPFRGQEARFPSSQRMRYRRILAAADHTVVLAEHYSPECYSRRNDFLTDNAQTLVAWYDGSHEGGTHYTVARARRLARTIINLRQSEQLEIEF